MDKEIYMNIGENVKTDFNKVFKVLKRKKYEHREGKTVDACFRDWGEGVDFDDYEEVLAYLIRFVLMNEVIKFSKRLEREDCDMRDILLFLIVKGMGFHLLSQIVEVSEKGLNVLYDEKDYEGLKVCLEMMFKVLEESVDKLEKTEGVMLQ
jgi:hypothetical protein